MAQVSDLASLQDFDDVIARLEGELAEARTELEDDDALVAARGSVAGAEERCAGLEREQRRLEGEIDGLVARVEREEGRLYDGSVSLPKELATLQQEIASLRSRLSNVEDTELELLDSLEEAEAQREEARAALDREQAAWSEKRERLGAVVKRIEGEVTATTAERDACRGRISAPLVAQYEDLRRRRSGVAVAHMQGNTCTACRVSVPPSARKRALDRETPALCPNCERILVGF